ncbi:hypothetical protein QJQ45_021035, partial [Haematococcus lacustris]
SSAAFQYPIDVAVQDGLGPVYWPMDELHTSPEATAHFGVGLKQLHVFWYDEAIKSFERCIDVDPGFSLGYWGLALAYKQVLWQTEDLQAGQQALQAMEQKQGRQQDLSPRAALYIKAVKKLYAPDKSIDERERAYNAAMEAVWEKYPDDVDACGFFTVSSLGMLASAGNYLSDQESDQVLDRARSVLDGCVARWPDHAGLLHYVTHAYDFPDPAIAAQGLSAGLHLSEVAPAACHAQHMKSHLFLELGNWSQVVDSNWRAVQASDAFCNRWFSKDAAQLAECDKDDRYHALEWQMFGLTMQVGQDKQSDHLEPFPGLSGLACTQGAFTDARALLGRMLSVYSVLPASPYDQWVLRMWAHQVMQSHAYPDVPPLLPPSALPPGAPVPSLKDTLTTLLAITNVSNALPSDEDIFWVSGSSPSRRCMPGEQPWQRGHMHSPCMPTPGKPWMGPHGPSSFYPSSPCSISGFSSPVEVQVMHARIQDALAFLLRSAPPSMPYIRLQMQVHTWQVQALQIVTSCLHSGRLDSSCTGWLLQMEQALQMESRIWDNPSAPSLRIVPVAEMFGHLLVLTSQQPARASTLFSSCLDQLPNRQTCVLGMGRSAALAGDGPTASSWYARLWEQCSPAAAPPDFLAPGLTEAYFMALPVANMTSLSASDSNIGSAGQVAGQEPTPSPPSAASQAYTHNYFFMYGSALFLYPRLPVTYYPSPHTYQGLARQYPPPYPLPLDLDPRNRQRLAAQGYVYGARQGSTVLGHPVSSPVMGYPAGSVSYDQARHTYTYSSGASQAAGYWPSTQNMYTDLQRAAHEAARPSSGRGSQSGKTSSKGGGKGRRSLVDLLRSIRWHRVGASGVADELRRDRRERRDRNFMRAA